MPALISGISHVGLAVSDMEASYKFFQTLGFEKVGGSPEYPAYFLCETGSGAIVTLWQTPGGAAPFDRKGQVGLHHLALRVATEAALDAAYEAAIKVEGATSEFSPQPFELGVHAMVYDPSGIRVELAYHTE
jgi:catechol 2,3-dioxygenase-like lactoylglutathione lyase family enzyme